jgi:hypothetical protein
MGLIKYIMEYRISFGNRIPASPLRETRRRRNTFHAECLNAVNTPAFLPGFPAGTVSFYTIPPGGLPVGTKVLVIS